MTSSIQEPAIVGREPTHEEIELVGWAEEAVRGGLALAQDALRQMVTLTTALLAGSAAFLDKLATAAPCKVLGVVLLVFALAFSLWGSFPREIRVNVYCAEEIRRARQSGAAIKMRCLKGAGACLVAAFCVLLGGMIGR